ncbi:MAG: hypothetical protein HY718_00600 [Planctomycetes bacterium]|nr:hypothetical protein [Planctomycetota bacterium]
MAIRFTCPSCQQPIEVDDNWGGQSVACPYCRKVVTAPRASTWPPGDIRVASPAQPGFGGSPPLAPPAPPPGYAPTAGPWTPGYPPPLPGRTGWNSGGWALGLAIASAVLCVAGMFIWAVAVGQVIIQTVGPNPTQQQVQQELQRLQMTRGIPATPAVTKCLFVGTACGIAALVMAIRSLVRGERRPAKPIAACLIAALFVFCQIMAMLSLLHYQSGRS